MGFGKVRFKLQRPTDRRAGLRDDAPVPVKAREGKMTMPGFVVELKPVKQSFLSFIVTVLSPVNLAQRKHRRSAAGLQLNRALKGPFCLFPFSLVHERSTEQQVGFIKVRISSDCFFQMVYRYLLIFPAECFPTTNHLVTGGGWRAGVDNVEQNCCTGFLRS